MPETDRKLRVFLCHASEDKPIVRDLHKRLVTEGWINPWLDEDRLLLGEDWDMKVQRELEVSDVVLVFISDAAVKKTGYVQKELRLIYDLSFYKPEDTIFVIPLRLEECEPPWRFRLWQWGDYFGDKKEITYQKLLRSLRQRYQQKAHLDAEEQTKGDTEKAILSVPEQKKSINKEEHTEKTNLYRGLPPLQGQNQAPPPLSILLPDQNVHPNERMINQTAGLIEKTLHDFGVAAIVIGFRVGPTITQFAIQPGFNKRRKTQLGDDAQQLTTLREKIVSLQKDLELALSVEHLRIEAPVPGKPYIGIEIPNSHKMVVRMRSILEADVFRKLNTPLAIALGRDISGQPVVADLIRLPHLLIAGATGSGKSVCVTAIAACLAINNSPKDLRIAMIDARMVELSRFNGLPHLLGKVEVNIERILSILTWLVSEMEHRYRLLEAANVNDIEIYNRRAIISHNETIPRIVVLIDEIADLMMSASASTLTQHNIVQLSKRAHATGIHLVITTQRPSTNILPNLIKANFPARLAFAVTSGLDSRIILDTTGAENLLGRGDMLYLNTKAERAVRAQGVMITDEEIEHIISYWQKNVQVSMDALPWDQEKVLDEKKDESLVEQAISVVRQSQRASASLLQRRLRIGYPRAARLLDQLEELGVVGSSQGGGKEREVLLGRIEEE